MRIGGANPYILSEATWDNCCEKCKQNSCAFNGRFGYKHYYKDRGNSIQGK
jgi:hypothetical protein